MQRRKAREEAFKLLFEAQFHPEREPDVLLENYYAREGLERDGYLDDVVKNALSLSEEVRRVISLYAVNWKQERISKTSYAVLSLAVCEIERRSDVPVKVSANETVELLKKYEGEEASGFLNGILGSFIRSEGHQFPKDEDAAEEAKDQKIPKDGEEAEDGVLEGAKDGVGE